MLAEWEKQKGVWLQWPHEDRNYGYQRKLEAITNFLISNKVVLALVYGNVSDEHAIKILAKLFSSRKIIKINSGAIAENGGEIHCVTQQQPEGKIEWYRKE